jgi:hypothetical protein
MAFTTPITDIPGTRLLAEITSLTAAAALVSVTHANAINMLIVQKKKEFMDYMLDSGKVSYAAFNANLTYGS